VKELKVIRVYKTDKLEDVYNLEVKDFHNYLVGQCGVVSHNCDCLRYYVNTVIKNIQNWKGDFVGEQKILSLKQEQKGTITDEQQIEQFLDIWNTLNNVG